MPPGLAEGAREVAPERCEVVPDRGEAIKRAVSRAAPGDLVLVLGRGPRSETVAADGNTVKVTDAELLRRALRPREA